MLEPKPCLRCHGDLAMAPSGSPSSFWPTASRWKSPRLTSTCMRWTSNRIDVLAGSTGTTDLNSFALFFGRYLTLFNENRTSWESWCHIFLLQIPLVAKCYIIIINDHVFSCSDALCREVVDSMVKHFKVTIFGDCLPVYDGKKSLYTASPLPVASGGVSSPVKIDL